MTIARGVVTEPTASSARKLTIDFLYLDLTSCTRCRGTDDSLQAALTAAGDVLTAAGVEVEVRKVHIRSQAEAGTWRFMSSPTLRINGSDIAFELRESSCGSEACVDSCGDEIACRVWVFGGREYNEPPVELVVDAILRQVYGQPDDAVTDQPYQLPDNLRRFFAGRTASKTVEPVPVAGSECCSSADHDTCCAHEGKPGCCTQTVDCGCR